MTVGSHMSAEWWRLRRLHRSRGGSGDNPLRRCVLRWLVCRATSAPVLRRRKSPTKACIISHLLEPHTLRVGNMTQKVDLLPRLHQVLNLAPWRVRPNLFPHRLDNTDKQLVNEFVCVCLKRPQFGKMQLEHGYHERLGYGQRVEECCGRDGNGGRMEVVV